MARTPKEPAEKPAGRAVANRKQQSTAMMSYEERLEAEAEAAAGLEKGSGTGLKSFSFKGGQLTFDGAAIPGNQVAVIVVASAIEKAYYEGRYDPNNPEPPVCYALTQTDPDDLAPDPEKVADLQNDVCETCPHNQWGSADTGRGKACKDVRRLILMPAGNIEKNGDVKLIDDPKTFEKSELGSAKLPPTALNAWAAYVRLLAATVKRPPHGVFTLMSVEPDATNQFKITFEALDPVDKKLLPVVYKRHDEAVPLAMQDYTYLTDEQKAARDAQNKAGRGRGGPRQAASGGRGAAKSSAGKPAGKAASGGAGRGRKY